MKTLKDHVILYDAVCPMCNLYTKGFVKAGMLDKNGRLPYQEMPANIAGLVDRERAVNEIALVHQPTGTVYYGVESLFRIIGNSFPVFGFLFRCKPFIKMIDTLYKFISFNRRVIIPAKKEEVENRAMNPAFHKSYRIAYLLFTWMFTAFVLYHYSFHFNDRLPESNLYREFLVCGGQMVWQLAVICLLKKEQAWDYLGNMMTISFGGALLLLLVMVLGKIFHWNSPFLYVLFFGLVVFLMFLEHIRRTAILKLGWPLTASWILYRILILFFILIPFYV